MLQAFLYFTFTQCPTHQIPSLWIRNFRFNLVDLNGTHTWDHKVFPAIPVDLGPREDTKSGGFPVRFCLPAFFVSDPPTTHKKNSRMTGLLRLSMFWISHSCMFWDKLHDVSYTIIHHISSSSIHKSHLAALSHTSAPSQKPCIFHWSHLCQSH